MGERISATKRIFLRKRLRESRLLIPAGWFHATLIDKFAFQSIVFFTLVSSSRRSQDPATRWPGTGGEEAEVAPAFADVPIRNRA